MSIRFRSCCKLYGFISEICNYYNSIFLMLLYDNNMFGILGKNEMYFKMLIVKENAVALENINYHSYF